MLNEQIKLFVEQIRPDKVNMSSKESVIHYIESFGGKCVPNVLYGKTLINLSDDIRFTIFYNWRMSDDEVIWELLKSLGHILLHTNINDSKGSIEWISNKSNETEQEDVLSFAASMVLPENEFRKFYQETHEKQYGKVLISDIANHFNTTNEAVILRGDDLGYFNDK